MEFQGLAFFCRILCAARVRPLSGLLLRRLVTCFSRACGAFLSLQAEAVTAASGLGLFPRCQALGGPLPGHLLFSDGVSTARGWQGMGAVTGWVSSQS